MTTFIRCYECAAFFEKRQGECSDCGAPVRGWYKPMHTAAVNAPLWAAAESAQKEKNFARAHGIAS